jgi:hypothetical protein
MMEPLQRAVMAQLNHVSVTGKLSTAYGMAAIFTDMPQPLDAEKPALFPFITYSISSITPFNTDTDIGGEAIVQIDCWHRGASDLPLAALADAVRARIERQPLSISGTTWITTELVSASKSDDPDGKTKRVMFLFRVVYMS